MADSIYSVDGRVALITGGGSGIGREIAKRYAESGATVIINDIRDVGREAADEIGGHFLRADLSDMTATRQLAEQALGHRGQGGHSRQQRRIPEYPSGRGVPR